MIIETLKRYPWDFAKKNLNKVLDVFDSIYTGSCVYVHVCMSVHKRDRYKRYMCTEECSSKY